MQYIFQGKSSTRQSTPVGDSFRVYVNHDHIESKSMLQPYHLFKVLGFIRFRSCFCLRFRALVLYSFIFHFETSSKLLRYTTLLYIQRGT